MFKRGDIVKQKGHSWAAYFHIECVHQNGALDVIDATTGQACGLSSTSSKLELVTLGELTEYLERRQRNES